MSGTEEQVSEVNGSGGEQGAVEGDADKEGNEETSSLGGADKVAKGTVDEVSKVTSGKSDETQDSEEEEDDEVFEVESILSERSRKGLKEYLVRWKGYQEDFDSWEPSENLNCEDAMEKFKKMKEEKAQSQQKTSRGRGRPKGSGGGGVGAGVKRSISKVEDVKDPPPKKKGRGRPKGSGGGTKKRRSPRESSEEEDDDDDGAPLVIRCKTIFKKHLIENAIKFENRRTSEDDNHPDPKVRYFMRYDIDTGEVFVGDIKIEVDEAKKELVCTSCGKIYSEQRSLEDKLENPNKKPLALWHIMREMKLHVIGFHLGGFTCPHCDEEEAFHTRGSTHFYRHMSTKHRDILDAQRSNKDID